MSEMIDDTVPLFIYMSAGCIAGAIEATATWPMEYIKTQLQLQRPPTEEKASLASQDDPDGVFRVLEDGEASKEADSAASSADAQSCYTGMFSGIIYTVRTHGFCALYQGLLPTLLGSIPKAGIRFGLFAWFSQLLGDSDGNLSIAMCFLAGLAAGAVEALVVVAPVETIKTKCIQLNMSFFQGLKEIILVEGIRGVYHGVFATVLKQSSNHGLRFVWYHEYKRIITHNGLYPLTPFESFIGGMTAGVFSAMGNQPFDVLKTRMQGVRAAEQYSSTWDCIRKTYASEGIAGFYSGIIPRLGRVVPGQGIIFMSFESIVILLVALQS